MTAVLRVTVTDLVTGDEQTKAILDHDYLVITTGDCYVANTQIFPAKGTHVLTIKGQRAVRDR